MTNGNTEKKLWGVANNLRANSKLSSAEYSTPVLGLIFLRHADSKFEKVANELEKLKGKSTRRKVGKVDYIEKGVLYLSEKARYEYLLNLPEDADIGQEIDNAMDLIEEENPELKDILPRGYTKFSNTMLVVLLKAFSKIADDIEGDVFGKIYEYFLGKFAMTEGQKGGEFFTPTSLVKLIVHIIEPFHGKVFDPACGSGGMFIQSAHFVEQHKKNPTNELMLYGQDKLDKHINLCKMNLAVQGLSGDIKEGNTFYEDIHKSVGKFDFVMANPPFNVKKVDYEKVKGDPRWVFGLPSTDNANYLWIQQFWTALNEKGRSGFVMANSASDARGNESKIREELIKENTIDVMISIASNFFYTVTLPCTLWFMDKDKVNTDRKDKVLFIDARNIFRQVDRAHREFNQEDINQIAGIVRSYRKEEGADKYQNVKGLCKVASIKDIEEQGWSLNPGRYVGVVEKEEAEGFDFEAELEKNNEELQQLNEEARVLEEQIGINVNKLLGD
jgi:type I restriction enzyme M protein